MSSLKIGKVRFNNWNQRQMDLTAFLVHGAENTKAFNNKAFALDRLLKALFTVPCEDGKLGTTVTSWSQNLLQVMFLEIADFI
jgi:hypothetical protein